MDDIFLRLRDTGLVPVIQLDDAAKAVPLARALLAGGIDIAEVTYRTDAAEESIRQIARHVPQMLVAAGTVTTVHQAQSAADAGARLIVSPGYDEEVVRWCQQNGVAVLPGVSSATQVQHARKSGLTVLKVFPAGTLGGTQFLSALRGPFADCLFMPTGGITEQNAAQYAQCGNVIAVSGSWMAPKSAIGAGDWQQVTDISRRSLLGIQGFSFLHLGLNTTGGEQAQQAAGLLSAFGFAPQEGDASIFCGTEFEVMKGAGRGTHGHIAIGTHNVERALHYLAPMGFLPVAQTKKHEGDDPAKPLTFVYLDKPVSGFDVHLKKVAR